MMLAGLIDDSYVSIIRLNSPITLSVGTN